MAYYTIILITINCLVLLTSGKRANSQTLYLRSSIYADSIIPKSKHCFCVPYWQCKDDFVGLVNDGGDIMDVRAYDEYIAELDEIGCAGEFDVCCEVQCGKLGRMSNASTDASPMAYRILNDEPSNSAYFGEFPWMLGLLRDRIYKCGASLIHPKVAITAAHCVATGGIFKVRAGEFDWEVQDEPMVYQDRHIQTIIIHPNYHAASLRNDIALLILNQEFKLTDNVGIVCLPPQAPIGTPRFIPNKQCMASGWGKNSYSNGAYQTKLKKVQLPLVSHNECLHKLRVARLGPRFQLHTSFLCAGGQRNRDTCKGDGGSPLVCPVDKFSQHFQQLGIVSWGLTCGLHNTPGVYVNVAMFVDWIDYNLEALNLDTAIYKLID